RALAPGREREGRPAPAGRACGADALRVHLGARLEEVEAAEAVPELQAGQARPPPGLAPAPEGVCELAAVVVAHHVVGEGDEALARETDRGPRDGGDLRVLEPPVGPVPVRQQDGGKGPAPGGRLEVARHEEAG